jgi:hypothetical protein
VDTVGSKPLILAVVTHATTPATIGIKEAASAPRNRLANKTQVRGSQNIRSRYKWSEPSTPNVMRIAHSRVERMPGIANERRFRAEATVQL